MRLACCVLTQSALKLAMKMRWCVDEPVDVYASEKLAADADAAEDIHWFARLSDVVKEIFSAYDALVFIMAAGIAVRMTAPHLKSKLTDPAILVFDERGKYGISLLSGHVGGGNALARILCRAIGAEPVITTATDVNGCLAPDALSGPLGLRPWPKEHIRRINRAVLAGDAVCWRIDRTLPHGEWYRQKLLQAGQQAVLCGKEDMLKKPGPLDVLVLGRSDCHAIRNLPEDCLCMTPRRLIAGIGCRRGVPEALVMQALDKACRRIGVDCSFLDALASTSFKAQEEGLLAAGRSIGCPVLFYENEEMASAIRKYHLNESSFVKQTLGIGNVCEAAACCCTGKAGGRMALCKTKFEKVTVALIWEK